MPARRILITGAGSGIGAELAVLLAAAGHEIVATDIDRAAALRVADDIVERGGTASGYGLDVTQPSAIETAVRAAGRVDVLVNNAGLQHVARLEEFPADRWAFLIAVMLTGAANMARAVLPGMRARNFGRIVNIGSIHSLVASPYKSAYIAAKHGLIGLSKTLALENGDVDVTVNTICPVYVRTPLVEKQIEAQAREHGISPERVVSDIHHAAADAEEGLRHGGRDRRAHRVPAVGCGPQRDRPGDRDRRGMDGAVGAIGDPPGWGDIRLLSGRAILSSSSASGCALQAAGQRRGDSSADERGGRRGAGDRARRTRRLCF